MALRAIAREQPTQNSVTLFLDGDVVLAPNALAECIGFMRADSKLAALTTNNDAVVEANDLARQWYRLRFAQRHLLMSSLALSGRLLVLTGRFSLYRTVQVIKPAFIEIIERDSIEHWLHGSIKLLSGDDKSAWHQILKEGGRMTYLPHVMATSFEALPGNRGFVAESTPLMMRWFGNMRRANGRAIRLGPKRCGPFLWWCLIDQRISPWTTQFGCAMAIIALVRGSSDLLTVCVAWMVVSRTVMAAAYGAFSGRFNPAWPLLLLYAQFWGSSLKIFLAFHPYLQSWTRQRISRNDTANAARLTATSLYLFSMLFVAAAAASMANLMVGA
ncbi:MAG: glycosyltransferase [Mesorhizobium sp.]